MTDRDRSLAASLRTLDEVVQVHLLVADTSTEALRLISSCGTLSCNFRLALDSGRYVDHSPFHSAAHITKVSRGNNYRFRPSCCACRCTGVNGDLSSSPRVESRRAE